MDIKDIINYDKIIINDYFVMDNMKSLINDCPTMDNYDKIIINKKYLNRRLLVI